MKKYKDILNTKVFVLLFIFVLSVFSFYYMNSVLKIIKYLYKYDKEITIGDICIVSYLTDFKLDNDIVFIIRIALPVILILFYFLWYFQTLFFSENKYMFVLRFRSIEKLSMYYITQVIILTVLSFFIYYFWYIPFIFKDINNFSGILNLIKIHKIEFSKSTLLLLIYQFMLSILNTIILVLIQNILYCYKKIRDKAISISLFGVIFIYLFPRKIDLFNIMFVGSFNKIHTYGNIFFNINVYMIFLVFLSYLLYLRLVTNVTNNMKGE